jgi:putative tryptophan/tyrosine transport system substrate-binding protein
MKVLLKISNAFLFLFVLGAILLLSDFSNRQHKNLSKDKPFSIAMVHWMHAPITENIESGIFKGLSDAGLTEDRNLTIDRYNASGDISLLNSILKQVKSQKPDLLFVSCTPALQSAIQTIREIPVVFTAVADPVLAGAGTNEIHHLKNVTGCSVVCDFETMCRLITENAPRIKTLGSIYCPGEIISVKFKEDFSTIASQFGLKVLFSPANNASELPDAVLSMIHSPIDAVCQMGDNLMSSGISTLIKGVVSANLPYFDFNSRPTGTKMESLIQLDVDYFQNGYNAARQAAEILLNGKSPGEIPFQKPTQTLMEINPDKAKKFGIVFSEKLKREATVVMGEKEPFSSPVRIAMAHYISSPDCDDVTAGILKRFAERGHHRDEDFSFDEYNANGDIATLAHIVRTIADKKYDLIFSTVLATTQALSAKIKEVPILFTVVADPVGNGLGSSYTHHLPNVTGIDGMSYTDACLELLKKYLPEAKAIGTLYNPGEMASLSSLKELKASCEKKGMTLVSVPVHAVSEITDATTLLCAKNIDALCQLPDTYSIPGFSSIVITTRKMKIPLFSFITSQVEMGAVAAIAGDFVQQGKEIADIAMDVIQGKSPNDIPFRRIQQIKTVINLQAAKEYGLKTPGELLHAADQIIEENG